LFVLLWSKRKFVDVKTKNVLCPVAFNKNAILCNDLVDRAGT
jgi:hypothetical protein